MFFTGFLQVWIKFLMDFFTVLKAILPTKTNPKNYTKINIIKDYNNTKTMV